MFQFWIHNYQQIGSWSRWFSYSFQNVCKPLTWKHMKIVKEKRSQTWNDEIYYYWEVSRRREIGCTGGKGKTRRFEFSLWCALYLFFGTKTNDLIWVKPPNIGQLSSQNKIQRNYSTRKINSLDMKMLPFILCLPIVILGSHHQF